MSLILVGVFDINSCGRGGFPLAVVSGDIIRGDSVLETFILKRSMKTRSGVYIVLVKDAYSRSTERVEIQSGFSLRAAIETLTHDTMPIPPLGTEKILIKYF